jgi:hypothetical protein
MALVVEDGTAIAGANSYASIAEADAALADREIEAWFAASIAKKVATLIEATDYVEQYDYVGEVEFADQELSWPRIYAYDREGRLLAGVPAQIKRAVILLAPQALSQPLLPSTTATSGALKRKKVGPLELEYFEGSAGSATGRSFPEVTGLLRGLIRGGPGGMNGRAERWS